MMSSSTLPYHDFDFKTQPYQHQFDAWSISRDRSLFGLFLDQGTGKSKILLDTVGYLFLLKKITALVLVVPKGVMNAWIDEQIDAHLSNSVDWALAAWTAAPRKSETEALDWLLRSSTPKLKILVMNVEALTDVKCDAARYLAAFIKRHTCLVAVDESTTIKNPKAHRTKILTKVCEAAPYRRIMSGNPIPNGPLDLYSQAAFLSKHLLGFPNYTGFRNRFAIMIQQTFGSRTFPKIVGYRDTDALKKMMREWSFIIKKEDCLDLPPKVFQTRDVDMSPVQKKAYNQMLDESYAMLDTGESASAPLVMTQLMKLHQIACGFLATDQGGVPFEDCPRVVEQLDHLESAKGKHIIWCTYRTNIRVLRAAIGEKFGSNTVVDFYGETSRDDRRDVTPLFQNPDSAVRFILANPATGRFGNTWTQGINVSYFSNSYDLEHRSQSEDRSHRIGQDKTVVYTDFRVPGTVDDRIIKVLRNKKKLTDEIVVSNWRWLLGERA